VRESAEVIDEDLESYLDKSPDAARVGKAVEYLVAASCILASGATLNVSTSMVDDEGVDLVFHRRGSSAALSAQVKARLTSGKNVQQGRFLASVRQQTFRPRDDLYLLFVVADAEKATFGPVWLVPSAAFSMKARPVGSRQNLRFSASLAADTRDQWRLYRLDREQLASRILGILDE
jgi:hypothetical protein